MNTLSSLKSQKRDKEALLRSYKRRLEQVKAVHSDLSSDFADNVNSVNAKLDAVISNCTDGILHCAGIPTQNDAVSRMKEKGSDNNLSDAKSYLSTEISRINREIRDIQSDIDRLNAQITAAANQA